jgi:ubiquinol-cytochrome c reductase cytochrome b/c1 subunit
MSHESSYVPNSGFERWMDQRLPLIRIGADLLTFPTPRNLNYFWTFGGILTVCLLIQIVTGIVLAMNYVASDTMAFDSIQRIKRDVNWGWLIQSLHAVGASMFFLAVYIHMFRGLYYGSYKAPREVLWILGCLIYLLMMATAFMGYSLVWGQMSYWAVTVITGLFGAFDEVIPGLGTGMLQWILGGYSVNNATLNRLFSLHYLLPFAIAGLVILHIWALHVAGNNNPTGLSIKKDSDAIPFHPYMTVKDGFALAMFALVFAWFVFQMPYYLGHAVNQIPANPLQTPAHIVPEWYFLPFYAILRAVPSKLGGVIAMFSAIIVLFFLPWLDTSRVRSAKYRPLYRIFFWVFVVVCLGLGYLGGKPPEGVYVALSQVFTVYYFAHFLIILPILGLVETPRPMPNSITESVLGVGFGSGGGQPVGAMAGPEKR